MISLTAVALAMTVPMTRAVPDSSARPSTNPAPGGDAADSARYEFALSRARSGTIQGVVFQDKNGDGVQGGSEKGVANVWVGIDRQGSVVTYDYTDGSGGFSIEVPANDPPADTPYSVEIIPPSGFYPTTSTEAGRLYVQSGNTVGNIRFGIHSFQNIALTANRVLSLVTGDLMEKDWTGHKTQNARHDADVILGADASGSDQISVWFNQYNNAKLFNTTRDYARPAPNSVLALSADSLGEDDPPFSGRLDLVTGTKLSAAGNFFIWFTQETRGNEGYLSSTYDRAYRTSDDGDVAAVQTRDLLGGSGIDIVVGTKSPTAGRGTIEIWQSDDAAMPTFSRAETYPPRGNLPGNDLGEVTSMQITKLRTNESQPDLVVGTRTGSYSGQFLVFGGGRGSRSVFDLDFSRTLANGAVTSLTCTDYDADSLTDVVLGVQTGTDRGQLQFWKNTSSQNRRGGSKLSFRLDTTLTVPWIPLALASGDLGSSSNPDIVVGYRNNTTDYTGGVFMYYMDGGTPPSAPVDPSGGTVMGMVPAVAVNNFNYGVQPSLPSPPYLLDIAAGVKDSPTTGSLQLFIR